MSVMLEVSFEVQSTSSKTQPYRLANLPTGHGTFQLRCDNGAFNYRLDDQEVNSSVSPGQPVVVEARKIELWPVDNSKKTTGVMSVLELK